MRKLWLAGVLSVAACGVPEEPFTAASQRPLTEATWAGRTANPDLFAAVIASPAGVEAYLCDGVTDHWFRGAGDADGVMDFEGVGGEHLLLQVDQGRLHGRLVAADAAETAFELPAVEGDVLFRAESGQGEERVLGGWIRLPDGAQRGAVRVGTLTSGSTLTNGVAECAVCGALGLTPAPFTPAVAQRRPNTLQRFTVIGLGDSYLSGEGAPVQAGNFNDDGTQGTSERWSDGHPQLSGALPVPLTAAEKSRLEREARACHRGAAGLGLALGELRRMFPSVQLVHQTFACSGAQVKHALDTPYGGPGGCELLTGTAKADCLAATDDTETPSIRPQLPEALGFIRAQGLALDAVVMSIGGNDLGFGYVIADCLGSVGGGCEAADSASRQVLAAGTAALPGQYDRLGAALEAAGVPDTNVFLAQYPNPLRRTASDHCSGLEFEDAILRFLSDEEATFAGTVHTQMNQLVSAGASRNGWRLVSSHVGQEVGHAMCNAVPWFNDTRSALHSQGSDLPPQPFGIHVSAGMVHPNQEGHVQLYQPAYRAMLEPMLRKRFTPRTPQNVRVTDMRVVNGRGAITLRFDDVNLFESRTVVRDAQGGFLAQTGADSTSVDVLFDGLSGTVSVEACLDQPALCSPRSTAFEVDVKKPTTQPASLHAGLSLSQLNPQLRLSWDDGAPTRMFSTVELDIGGVITRRAVEGQQVLLPEGTDLRRFRVATCNSLGCGPVSPWETFNRPSVNVLPPCENPVLNGCRK